MLKIGNGKKQSIMTYRMTVIIIAIAFVIGVFSAGCASSSNNTKALDSNSSRGDYAAPNEQASGVSKSNDSTASSDIASGLKKVVKNANVSLEVTVIDDSFKKISDWVNSNSGYEFSRNISVNGDYKTIYVVFKISPEKLTAFLEFLDTAGKILSSNTSTDDITQAYYDTAARLDNLKKTRDQFLEILKKAVTIEDTLKVQNELKIIQGDIESLQTSINIWDKMVAESTVSISISEAADPLRHTREVTWNFSSWSDIWKTMKNGFIIVSNTLLTVLEWVLIIAVSVVPLAIIVFAVILIIRSVKKKRKNKIQK